MRRSNDCDNTQRCTLNRDTRFPTDFEQSVYSVTDWLLDHWLAVTLFGMYTIALMVNAFAGLRASASLEGFYVGNRNLSGPLIGFHSSPLSPPPIATSVMPEKLR